MAVEVEEIEIDVGEAVIEEVETEMVADVKTVMAEMIDVETTETIGKFFYLTKFLLIF